MNETEETKAILEYEGDYLVSSLGYVLSLKSGVAVKICVFKHKNGYLTVSLSKDGKVKTHSLHSLVAKAFLEKPKDVECIVIDHKDNDKLNNRLSNLQYITNRKNSSKDSKKGSSAYTGVKKTPGGKFRADIRLKEEILYLCTNESEIYCSEVYLTALKKYRENAEHYLSVIYSKTPEEKRKYLTT